MGIERAPIIVVFLNKFLQNFGCYANLKLPLTRREKIEIWTYCYVIFDILTNLVQNGSCSNLLSTTGNVCKMHNLAGCHVNQIVKNRKYIQNSSSQEPCGQKNFTEMIIAIAFIYCF